MLVELDFIPNSIEFSWSVCKKIDVTKSKSNVIAISVKCSFTLMLKSLALSFFFKKKK